MSAAAPPPTPTVIAQRYELQRMLAQGGMAEVWLAVDLTLDRKVAVKWLKPSLATDPVVAERFRREAIAAASLNHPNIVAVHDVFEQDGRQAVVMQLVEGKSLRQVLDTQKRLSPELTCHIGTCVAAALDHAHEAGFVHRDVKPGNIMMTSDGRVLLTDFGIAKGLQSAEADLTSDNIMMGTAKYLSPEQVRGKKLDGRADLYSLGLVLYECLAGRVPFLGETDADTALARLQRDPTDLTRLRATLPTKLVVAIHKLLARNPAQRPATGAELVATLRDAAKEGPPPIDPTPYEQSPVSPFGAKRLRRAPSDVAGRAEDRARATRPAGPIPGEVAHVHSSPTPATNTRDQTPPAVAPRGKPAKGLTQEWRPAFTVVALLLVAGLVVGVLLWSSMSFGGGDPVTSTTALPAPQASEAPGEAAVVVGPASDRHRHRVRPERRRYRERRRRRVVARRRQRGHVVADHVLLVAVHGGQARRRPGGHVRRPRRSRRSPSTCRRAPTRSTSSRPTPRRSRPRSTPGARHSRPPRSPTTPRPWHHQCRRHRPDTS